MIRITNKNLGRIFSVNISEQKGTIKKPVTEITVGEKGIVGDVHYGDSERHVSMISIERIREFAEETGENILPGEFAENLTVEGLDLSSVKLYDRFKVGEVEIEVIQIGKPEVYKGSDSGIFRIIGKSVMFHEGIFCRVITTGKIATGDIIEYFPKQGKVFKCIQE